MNDVSTFRATSGPPAARPILASIPDLMAAVRVGEAARAAGVMLQNVDDGAWGAALAGSPRPAGAVVDLTAPGALDRIAAAVAAGVAVLAYGPHVEGGALAAAAAAGARTVVARGRMMQQAGALLAALAGASAAGATPDAHPTPPSTAEDDDDER